MEEYGFNVVQAYHTWGVLASVSGLWDFGVSGLWVSCYLTQPTIPYTIPLSFNTSRLCIM
jgi:hypothetical protein